MTQKLTPKQEQFCQEYLIDLNGTQAAIRAGYSAKTGHEQAAQLLAKLSIQARIAELRQSQQERTQLNADWVIDRLRKIADFDIRSVCTYSVESGWQFKPIAEWDESAFATITLQGVDKNGNPRIKAESKAVALESLAKHIGMYQTEIQPIRFPDLLNVGVYPVTLDDPENCEY